MLHVHVLYSSHYAINKPIGTRTMAPHITHTLIYIHVHTPTMHDRRGVVWAGPVTTSKLFFAWILNSHIKTKTEGPTRLIATCEMKFQVCRTHLSAFCEVFSAKYSLPTDPRKFPAIQYVRSHLQLSIHSGRAGRRLHWYQQTGTVGCPCPSQGSRRPSEVHRGDWGGARWLKGCYT